jgi:adenylate cyclase
MAISFCVKCAAPLMNRCPKCNFESPPGFDFCGRCGSRLSEPRPDVNSQRSASPPVVTEAARSPLESEEIPDGERKTVTALFADIKGSMELMEGSRPRKRRAPSSIRR